MKPKLIHKEAMDYSFRAKLAFEEGKFKESIELYENAAKLESQVAEFYFDKPELEPTRSIIIRSAAFLNIKAGDLESAQRFIFYGLLNINDENIKNELNDALEICISLKNMNPAILSKEYNYLNILRQKSVHYTLEPQSAEFGTSVSLDMIKSFIDNYIKSLKAYAVSKVKHILNEKKEIDGLISKEIDKIINPLVTNSSYGSFRFSIANDFLSRFGESEEIVSLKSSIVQKFHNNIFINPLDDSHIENIKEEFSETEINEIFRPIIKLKSSNSDFKIGYYETNTFSKKYVPSLISEQKKKLLTAPSNTLKDIGELVSTITHKRTTDKGSISRKTISSEEFKRYEADVRLKEIVHKDYPSLILTEEITVSMKFDSSIGFTFEFFDFKIKFTDTEYEKAINGFHHEFYKKVVEIAKNSDSDNKEDFKFIKKIIGNIDELK